MSRGQKLSLTVYRQIKGFFHVIASLRAGLYIRHIVLFRKSGRLFIHHFSLVFKIVLGPDQHRYDPFPSVIMNSDEPISDVFEGLLTGKIEAEDRANRVAEKERPDRVELFLAGGVHNVELHDCFALCDLFRRELDADR